MTIILYENLPHGLLRVLAPRQVTTVQLAGYAGVKNGELLAALEGAYDVFVTGDKNLRYQQNLTGRRLAIIELPTNRWPALRTPLPANHPGGRSVPSGRLHRGLFRLTQPLPLSPAAAWERTGPRNSASASLCGFAALRETSSVSHIPPRPTSFATFASFV